MEFGSRARTVFVLSGAAILAVIIVWQAFVFRGTPEPANSDLSLAAAILSCSVLVFREGLEAILVLAAIVATVTRKEQSDQWKGVVAGASIGALATIVTWFVVVAILSDINLPELDLQAATGLLAIAVLLVVMNWFFHRIYWTGWITHHTSLGKKLMSSPDLSSSRIQIGLLMLGFTAMYREGFEVVLFLQQLRLRDGNAIVFTGAGLGFTLTAIAGVLTFIAHKRLPFRKMLVLTGVLLGGVLLVMVGESVQEMQLAGWIPATPVHLYIPDWLGMWLAVFPNWEGLSAQLGAAFLVLGSYLFAEYMHSNPLAESDRSAES